jgi:hypothetical protein
MPANDDIPGWMQQVATKLVDEFGDQPPDVFTFRIAEVVARLGHNPVDEDLLLGVVTDTYMSRRRGPPTVH